MGQIINMSNLQSDVVLHNLLQHIQLDDLVALLLLFSASLAYSTKGQLWSKPDPYRYKLFERPQQQDGASSQRTQTTRDLASRMEQAGADTAILWASQSGTAERFAGRLAKDLNKLLGAKTISLDISDIEPASCTKLRSDQNIIFLASTFGEGDPSDNMHEFWAWLQSQSSEDLSKMRFAAFGLGNSRYKHYNRVIDVVVTELQRRGAECLMEIGRADDATRQTEEHFYEWKEKLLNMFEAKLGYERREAVYEPAFDIVHDATASTDTVKLDDPFTKNDVKFRRLSIAHSAELLTNPGERNCLHLEFDISSAPELKYRTGDYLAIWPVNPTAEADILLQLLGLKDDRTTPLRISPLDDATSAKVPSSTTAEALFRHHLEICAPVSREFVKTLAAYAPTEPSKELLHRITKSKASFAEFGKDIYLNVGRLLQAACSEPGAWKSVPLSLLIEMLPAIQPRYYSISSSSMVDPKRIAITVIVDDKTTAAAATGGVRIPGLATNYLLHARDGSHPRGLAYSLPGAQGNTVETKPFVSVRKSTFRLPTSASAPVVMIGAGTGVAPFRAFVQERARLKQVGKDVGRTTLFFGCRNEQEDYIYADEFRSLGQTLGDGFDLHTAFSRPTDGSKKHYVQDVVRREAERMAELLVEQNAYFYICGSAAMARDISQAVGEVLMRRFGWSEEALKEFTERQKRQRRWLQDVWA